MLLIATFFLSGVLFTAFAVWMLIKRRLLVASVNGTAGISLLSTSMMLALVFLNLHTYIQLTSEQKLAKIQIGIKTDAGIPITIQTDNHQQIFYINSEEWQLDARFLKWKSWAYLLGSEPVVRLESLAERRPFLKDIVPVRHNLVNQYPILTDLGSSLSEWLGIVDTYYGSAVYMPAIEGSTYTVSATISGLIARAENNEAQNAVQEWMRP